MLENRAFWVINMLACGLVYLGGLLMAVRGEPTHWLAILAVILLVAHLLEIPYAFGKLRDKNPEPLRVIILVLLFGLVWWVPAKRGIFSVR